MDDIALEMLDKAREWAEHLKFFIPKSWIENLSDEELIEMYCRDNKIRIE
jgi:hypothetical protein